MEPGITFLNFSVAFNRQNRMPVVNLDKTVTDIEEMEEGIDTKQGVDTKDVRAEFATKIEGLISKIENPK